MQSNRLSKQGSGASYLANKQRELTSRILLEKTNALETELLDACSKGHYGRAKLLITKSKVVRCFTCSIFKTLFAQTDAKSFLAFFLLLLLLHCFLFTWFKTKTNRTSNVVARGSEFQRVRVSGTAL